jgi:branched-chain amino acid transport system substrate-binding protein
LAGEVYTQLGQTDYAAEIAQIRASGADSVFFFLPGGMGIAFMKQYAQSGVDIPLIGPAFSFDQGILQAVGDAALGVKNTAQWSKDIDNEPTRRSSKLPGGVWAAAVALCLQGFDTANLLLSALDKASPYRMPMRSEAALKSRFRLGARQVLLWPEPSPDPGHLCA